MQRPSKILKMTSSINWEVDRWMLILLFLKFYVYASYNPICVNMSNPICVYYFFIKIISQIKKIKLAKPSSMGCFLVSTLSDIEQALHEYWILKCEAQSICFLSQALEISSICLSIWSLFWASYDIIPSACFHLLNLPHLWPLPSYHWLMLQRQD